MCSKRIEPGRVAPRRIGIFCGQVSDAERHVPFYRGRDGSGGALSDVSNFLLALPKGDSTESVIRDSLSYEKARWKDRRMETERAGGRRRGRNAGTKERGAEKAGRDGAGRGGRAGGGRGGEGRRARPTRTFVTRHQTRLPPVGDSTDRL